MKIFETLDRDPRSVRLANNGQARIDGADTELRAELETFVCEGQFSDAMQRILESYLINLNNPRQNSAWVSGFFGSGKSHLLKMLEHLWVNTSFSDGSTARSLVRSGLPSEIEALLRELDTHAARSGKPAVAAAGTLLGDSVDHVRRTVLSIVLQARGLPIQYPQAMFYFWLRDQGTLEAVRTTVEQAGKDWLKELNNLYVSPVIAKALIQADPSFAGDVKAARQVVISQFPQLSTDISTSQFIEAARKALTEDDELPLTIIVLDEVQQYINEVSDRASSITEVAEAMQTQFDSRIMLVGAGQSALSAGTPALMWLRDRFVISIELTDADVEAVTRKVLLHKKSNSIPPIESMFDHHAGEVGRHLQGTTIAERPEDRKYRAGDYPLLPTRRRFWEACFQAADAAGTHSQLRSQLRILHDSLHDIAEQNLGHAIPASDLFNALSNDLVNTGVLLNEISTRIKKLEDGTDDGRLRRDLCGLVFLIGKLPREQGVDTGIRADSGSLADLIIRDISKDSGQFRDKVARTLEELAAEGVLMKVGSEFRLQTTEGAAWDQKFRERQAALRQNEPEIQNRRDHAFGQAVQKIVLDVKLIHGDAKIRRTLALHRGNEPPKPDGDQIQVWLRDGWSSALNEVESEARRLGQKGPTLHVHLPKKSADDLKSRIIDAEAAQQVIDHYGTPSSDPGREAREGTESRLRAAGARRDEIVRDIIRAAKLFQGGGSEIFGDGLSEKIQTGANASLARLFPRFGDGDHKAWAGAIKRAKDGSDQPFKIVGWDGATEDHTVAKVVLEQIGVDSRGSEIQKNLKAAPYGWPQDAVDAALIALHRSGHLRATRNGHPVVVGALDQTGVKAAEFRPEKIRLTTPQRIALRSLFERADVSCKSGEEEVRAISFLEAVKSIGQSAGGNSPLPPTPDLHLLDDLGRLSGTEQLDAILEKKQDLEKSISEWNTLKNRAHQRSVRWEKAAAFRHHADGLPILAEVVPELKAIAAQRSLLAETDHVTPLTAKLAGALREALTSRQAALTAAIKKAEKQLALDSTWVQLDAAVQSEIRNDLRLVSPAPLDINSDDRLGSTLNDRSLAAWQAEVEAVPSRVANALSQAADRLRKANPEVVTTTVEIRRGTLANKTDVQGWIEEHGRKLKEAVTNGPVIVK